MEENEKETVKSKSDEEEIIKTMDIVRYGIAGMGSIGMMHADKLLSGSIPGGILCAVCTGHTEKLQPFKEKYPDVRICGSYREMLSCVDAALIATPHPLHPQMAIEAFGAGKHVLIEKPAGADTKHVRLMNKAAADSGKVFAIMYNMRLNPLYKKVRELVRSGELGALKRITWLVTDWYRSQAYYDTGTWRATWEGEGGGVLMNQAVHNLDLLQWITGIPDSVQAFMQYGAGHNIQVEDDVTAYLQFPGGATGLFVTATHEVPGTNRLEIAGDRGKLVAENNEIIFYRNRISEREFNIINTDPFAKPENWRCHVPVKEGGDGHAGILREFTDAILYGKRLTAPGEDGILGLTLANAMYLSAAQGKQVDLKTWDDDEYYELLRGRIEKEKN